MASVELKIRGDQLGTFSSLSGDGNGADRRIVLSDTKAYGTKDQVFIIRVDQISDKSGEFVNGQQITILDEKGVVVMRTTMAQPDIEQGLGAGDEHLILQSAGFLIDLTGVETGKMVYSSSDEVAAKERGDNDGNLDFADTRRDFPCFASGTQIDTPRGRRLVQDLMPGDLLTDLHGPTHSLLWTAARTIPLAHPDHPQRPVLFRPGSLPGGGPDRDLLVSPQHRMLLHDATGAEVLAPAKALLNRPGVRLARGLHRVTYHALLLPRHAILLANGTAAESLYPGPHILRQLSMFQRLQVLGHCPALLDDPAQGYGPPARRLLPVRQARHAALACDGQANRSVAKLFQHHARLI